jgi:hypothetical protein|tara:strand:+ start:1140 stop:1370 length:231 start_codon:yes stop_codon:yes gene_type:complete
MKKILLTNLWATNKPRKKYRGNKSTINMKKLLLALAFLCSPVMAEKPFMQRKNDTPQRFRLLARPLRGAFPLGKLT